MVTATTTAGEDGFAKPIRPREGYWCDSTTAKIYRMRLASRTLEAVEIDQAPERHPDHNCASPVCGGHDLARLAGGIPWCVMTDVERECRAAWEEAEAWFNAGWTHQGDGWWKNHRSFMWFCPRAFVRSDIGPFLTAEMLDPDLW